MNTWNNQLRIKVLAGMAVMLLVACRADTLETRNVFLIVSDGLRWQEVFEGAEEKLLNKEAGGVSNPDALKARFWRDTPELRREALLPFFWKEIARRGQLFGNRTKGSVVSITNGRNFSYPGYNEILTGFVDPVIDSNRKLPNPNVTVFEWMNQRADFQGRVAVFATWDVFPFIFNIERSRLPIWPGWQSSSGRVKSSLQPCSTIYSGTPRHSGPG